MPRPSYSRVRPKGTDVSLTGGDRTYAGHPLRQRPTGNQLRPRQCACGALRRQDNQGIHVHLRPGLTGHGRLNQPYPNLLQRQRKTVKTYRGGLQRVPKTLPGPTSRAEFYPAVIQMSRRIRVDKCHIADSGQSFYHAKVCGLHNRRGHRVGCLYILFYSWGEHLV